jgi:superfamily II DNA or RNA helicase
MEKPKRRKLVLKMADNRTHEVRDFNVAEFIQTVTNRKTIEAPHPSKSGAEPVHRNLYPLPDTSAFLAAAVESLKRFKPTVRREQKEASCSNKRPKFAHHEVLAAYYNVMNPFRGILIYHGMGSGKTCASISAAESMVGRKKPIWVLTPEALEANYRDEMLKCSKTYKLAQHWAARKQGWIVLPNRKANFDELGPKEQQEVTEHVKGLLESDGAYTFAAFNGLDCSTLRAQFPQEGNPFHRSVVVIDEVHLLVKHIAATKMNATSPYTLLYEWLLDAEDCRVVALSGTPRAHDVTDLGILFNLIHGYLKVWKVQTPKLIEDPLLKKWVHQQKSNGKTLELTRTPHGFEAVYDETGVLKTLQQTDAAWDDYKFKSELSKHGQVADEVEKHKLLPDQGAFVSEDVFQQRILGMTSYFPDLTPLMPTLNPRRVHDVKLSEYQSKQSQIYNVQFPENMPRIERTPPDACQNGAAYDDPKYDEAVRKTLETLKKHGVFTKLDVYAPKLKEVVQRIVEAKTKQLVYTALMEDVVFAAEALTQAGFTRLKLAPPNPPEQVGWVAVPNKTPEKVFVVYTGSEPERELLIDTFNKGGARVFLTAAEGVEGISLADVADVHLLEPTADPTTFTQIVGRARRMCKNKTVESVTPHVYLSGKHEKETYEASEKKQAEIDHWLSLVRETAVDCALHGDKCVNPTKSRVVHLHGQQRTVQYGKPDEKGLTPLFEPNQKEPLGYAKGSTFYDAAKKKVESMDALVKPVQETVAVRKRMKLNVGEVTHFFFVVAANGLQPMYKEAEGNDEYGHIEFGPPRIFYKNKTKVSAKDLFEK